MDPVAVLARTASVALGAFLLVLGGVVATRSLDRGARALLGGYLGLVGLNYLLDALSYLVGGPQGQGAAADAMRHAALVASILDPPLLLLFALVVASGPPRPLRVALALSPGLLLLALYALFPSAGGYMATWPFRFLYLAELGPCYAAAFLLLLRRYLQEGSPLPRERLGLLVVAVGLVVLPRLPLLAVDAGVWKAIGPRVTPFLAAGLLALHVAVVAAARAHHPAARPGGAHAGPLRALAPLHALVALEWLSGLAPPLEGVAFGALYSFRWLLVGGVLALGLRSHDILDLPGRAHDLAARGLVATLVALCCLQAAAALASFSAMAPAASLGLAFGLAAAGLAVRFAFRRAFPPPRDELAWRRANLYRALLEAGAPEEDLAAARRRWGLSEREAREIEALRDAEGSILRAAPHAHAPLAPGVLALGRYEVHRLLGAGGFGRTFLGWDRVRGEEVVLKEPHPGLLGPDEARAATAEAEALARVESPHVARLRALERGPSGPLLVLDHVEGETLRARLARAPLAQDELRRLAEGLLAGVAALHREGLLHRDVKPENVLLRPDGSPVLVDLGLAAAPGGDTRRAPGGTPGYASPEQLRGAPLGPASDLYAVARVLWEAGGARDPAWREPLLRGMDPDVPRRWKDAEGFLRALRRTPVDVARPPRVASEAPG